MWSSRRFYGGKPVLMNGSRLERKCTRYFRSDQDWAVLRYWNEVANAYTIEMNRKAAVTEIQNLWSLRRLDKGQTLIKEPCYRNSNYWCIITAQRKVIFHTDAAEELHFIQAKSDQCRNYERSWSHIDSDADIQQMASIWRTEKCGFIVYM